MKKNLDVILLILGFLLMSLSWWYFWISPRDEALLDIAECMGSDLSPESYEQCVHQWKNENIIRTYPNQGR